MYINQGGTELYRLKIYISEAVSVVNDVQPAHWYIDCNKAPNNYSSAIKKRAMRDELCLGRAIKRALHM